MLDWQDQYLRLPLRTFVQCTIGFLELLTHIGVFPLYICMFEGRVGERNPQKVIPCTLFMTFDGNATQHDKTFFLLCMGAGRTFSVSQRVRSTGSIIWVLDVGGVGHGELEGVY